MGNANGKGAPRAKAAPRAKGAPRATAQPRTKAAPALSGEQLTRMRTVLDSQRRLGGGSYPVPIARLFELAEAPMTDAALKVFTAKKNAEHFALTARSSKSDPGATQRALVFLPADEAAVAGSPAVLDHALESARGAGGDLFTPKELAARVPTALRRAFQASVEAWARAGESPLPGVLVLRRKSGKKVEPFLCRIEPPAAAARAQQPAAATSREGFAREFAREFERLDRASGNNNHVLLHDLRRALPGIGRDEFDSRLRELRLAKLFTLDSPDGRHVRLSPEQLDAGIREGSANLVYVARR